MARGAIAKRNVVEKLAETFKEDFVGEFNNKIYILADDGGERVQIAISLTCPKVAMETGRAPQGDYDFTKPAEDSKPLEIEITTDERQNIATLLEKLGL